MRAEGVPGVADEADDLALADARAEARAELRLVGVARRQARAVLDAGVVAVAAGRADALHEHDAAVVGGVDRRADRGRDVDAGVDVAGALLAEGAGDRPVDRPDHAARALADREVARLLDLVELRGDLARRRLEVVDVALEALAVVAHLPEGGRLAGLRP